MNVFDLVQVYISTQSSGKPIQHFVVDDQFKHLSGIYLSYIFITHRLISEGSHWKKLIT